MLQLDLFSKNSPKNHIFNILIQKGKLTAKEIHNILKRQFAIKHTYQATYKLLKTLLEDNILKRDGLKYEVNTSWIIKQRDILDSILSSESETSNCIYTSEFIRIYKLHSLKAIDNFIQDTILKLNRKYKVDQTYWKTPHCWWLLSNPLDEDQVIGDYVDRELKSSALITSDTRLDIVAKKYYDSKPQSYVSCNITSNNNKEIVQVIGEFTLLFVMPDDIIKELDVIYDMKKTSEILPAILELVSRKQALEVKVIRDKKIADTYIAEITSQTTNHENS